MFTQGLILSNLRKKPLYPQNFDNFLKTLSFGVAFFDTRKEELKINSSLVDPPLCVYVKRNFEIVHLLDKKSREWEGEVGGTLELRMELWLTRLVPLDPGTIPEPEFANNCIKQLEKKN